MQTDMIRIKRHVGKRLLLSFVGGLVIIGAFGGAAFFTFREKPVEAAVTSRDPSVLNFPNVPVIGSSYPDESKYSVQDVKFRKTSYGNYRVDNNYDDDANKWAEGTWLEIAKIGAHHMKSIEAGVYVTDDALRGGLNLTFVAGTNCRIYDTDHDIDDAVWSALNVNDIVLIEISGDNGATWTTVKSFNAGNKSEKSKGFYDKAPQLCGVMGRDGAGYTFDLNGYKNTFQTDPETGLKKVQVRIGYNDTVYRSKQGVGLVRFKMRLANTCGTAAECREYIAPIRASSDNPDPDKDANRNYSQIGSKPGAPESNKDNPPQYLLRKYFEFGLPCTVGTPTEKKVNIYDVNDSDWVLQADGAGNLITGPYDRLVGVLLQRYGTGGWENVPSNEYSFKDYQNGKVYDGVFVTTTIDDRDKVSATNRYLYGMTTGDVSAEKVVIPRSGNKVTTQLTFTLQPATRYRIMITPDGVRDFMAVGLPADSIFGMISCNSGVSPQVDASADSLVDGQRAGFVFGSVKDTARYYSTASSYNYEAKVWYESTDTTPINDSTFSAADDLQVAACTSSGGNEVHPASTENHEIAKCPGGYDPSNILTGIKIDAGAIFRSTGRYPVAICAELTLTALTGTEITAGTNPARKCIVIGKFPSIHVVGGDVKVGNGTFSSFVNQNASISTRSFAIDGRAYGSWGEYGLFAPTNGAIASSSGGMLSGLNGVDQASFTDVNKNRLTFANTNSVYGHWAPAGLISIPSAIMQVATDTSTLPAAQAQIGGNVRSASGEIHAWNLTAGGGTVNVRGELQSGSGSLIIFYNGTINMNGDITLGDSVINRIGSASQIIIIARNITIDPTVRTIDAWLIASPASSVSNDGRISTCGAVQGGAYYTGLKLGDTCDSTPLRINGPVIARELQLRRTFGADASSSTTAAEVVNLRPDAFIWGSGADGSMDIQTSFTTELPPRF